MDIKTDNVRVAAIAAALKMTDADNKIKPGNPDYAEAYRKAFAENYKTIADAVNADYIN